MGLHRSQSARPPALTARRHGLGRRARPWAAGVVTGMPASRRPPHPRGVNGTRSMESLPPIASASSSATRPSRTGRATGSSSSVFGDGDPAQVVERNGGAQAKPEVLGDEEGAGPHSETRRSIDGSIAEDVESVASNESMVVHHSDGDEPLSVKECITAYLEKRIPELEMHVNRQIAVQTEATQREVNEELAEQALKHGSQRREGDGRARYLILQKRLDANMPKWIFEAIKTWDQRKALEKKKRVTSDSDLIFEYLTKRAAHIDSGKFPSEIPIFKTLHASYSLPSMWRDKYG